MIKDIPLIICMNLCIRIHKKNLIVIYIKYIYIFHFIINGHNYKVGVSFFLLIKKMNIFFKLIIIKDNAKLLLK